MWNFVGGWHPFLPEILSLIDPVGTNTQIFHQYSLIAPQP